MVLGRTDLRTNFSVEGSRSKPRTAVFPVVAYRTQPRGLRIGLMLLGMIGRFGVDDRAIIRSGVSRLCSSSVSSSVSVSVSVSGSSCCACTISSSRRRENMSTAWSTCVLTSRMASVSWLHKPSTLSAKSDATPMRQNASSMSTLVF